MMTSQPDGIITATLQVVVMPNGEIISRGKHIGWFDDFKQYLTPVADAEGKPIRQRDIAIRLPKARGPK